MFFFITTQAKRGHVKIPEICIIIFT